MNNLQKHKLIKFTPFLLYIFALSIRLPGASFPPEKAYYNVIDERLLVNSTVALFGGQIPSNLAWPSGTLMAPLVSVYSMDFVISHPAIRSAIIHKDVHLALDELSRYIAESFSSYYDGEFIIYRMNEKNHHKRGLSYSIATNLSSGASSEGGSRLNKYFNDYYKVISLITRL